MAKKIAQYCYFGEDASESGYIPYTPLGDNVNITFKNEVIEGNIYVKDTLTKTFRQLDSDNEYNPTWEYFVVAPNTKVNYPTTITRSSLVSGSIFNNVTPIVKLGIQAIPGTKFRLNSNTDWIIVGMTGIYELDLTTSSATIMKLQFDETSLEIIDKNENAYLIIDIMSEYREG